MGNFRLSCSHPYPDYICLRPGRSKQRGHSQMATSTVVVRRPRLFLEGLSTELLVLVLEQLGDLDRRSLDVVRSLSRRLHAIGTPIKYRSLRLNGSVIGPLAGTYFPSGVANICAYTRHVIVDSNLDATHVKTLLAKIQNLSTITWRYVQPENFHHHVCWMPSEIISPRHLRNKDVKLYIENLPLREFNPDQPNPYLSIIPTEILESLKVATPSPPLTARLGSLKTLLTSCPRLKNFSYNDRGQGTRFILTQNERLPAFEELSLQSYDWDHTPTQVRTHWDFSAITRLDLIDVPLGPFLDSVSLADFRRLKRLRMDDFSSSSSSAAGAGAHRREDVTRKMYVLITQIEALVELEMTCDVASFPVVDALTRHGDSLRRLRVRDYVGFGDEGQICPTMTVGDLSILAGRLVGLRDLEVDLDRRCCDSRQFLFVLCGFGRLVNLTVHTQTALKPGLGDDDDDDDDLERDVDLGKVTDMLTFLVRCKQGWRSVTVNVGGWKSIMVRRLSASWRRLNGSGVFAERCFVLERDGDGDGDGYGMVVREEFPMVAT
ncbi:hypothetical protein GGS20DRAFT_495969 [Poronia punctata]|nr:hypothetical protein GGS20DRAFT_495969 [Poronia punctata]